MNRKVRTIIVDGTEIMTSLTAVEIADRLRTYDDLKDEVNRKDNIINDLEKCIKEKYNEAHNYQTKIRQSDLQQGDYPVSYYYAERDEKMSIYYLDKLNELKESGNNE